MFWLILLLVLFGCSEKEPISGDITLTEHKQQKQKEVSEESMSAQEESPIDVGVQHDVIAECGGDRVSFDFNRAELLQKDLQILKKIADFLILYKDLKIEIQGNCDIRGSADYNIALGEKRANAVFEYLKANGVAEHRMKVVSYGSRVLEPGDTEEIYAKNRVGIVVVI